jgi:hypothetical protein
LLDPKDGVVGNLGQVVQLSIWWDAEELAGLELRLDTAQQVVLLRLELRLGDRAGVGELRQPTRLDHVIPSNRL